MWNEIGTTIRHAIADWGTTTRMCVLAIDIAVATAVVLWAMAL